MGCDIHQRTFFWSKINKKYVGTEEICDHASTYDIVGDRYYDYFGLFGNSIRSEYPALDCLNFGLPDALPKTAKASFEYYGSDYHTISWSILPELYASMNRYLDKLKNPAKFLLDNPESFQEKFFDLPEWQDCNSNLTKYLEDKIKTLKWLIEDRDFEKIIDPDKTMILIYFDN